MIARPTTDEEHKYLTDVGFVFVYTNQQYIRLAGDWTHFLGVGSDRSTPRLLYWNAVGVHTAVEGTADSPGGLEIVVQHREHFTSPISCFVTAEVRQWRRPEAS